MGGDDDADRAIDARELLNDDGVFDIAEPGAAVLFGEDGAHVPEFAEFFDDGEGEDLVFIPLKDMGRDFGFRKFADSTAELDLLGCVVRKSTV